MLKPLPQPIVILKHPQGKIGLILTLDVYQHLGGDTITPPDFDQLIDGSATTIDGAARALELGFEKAIRAAPINGGVNRRETEFQKLLEIDIQRGLPCAVLVAHWLLGHGVLLKELYHVGSCD